MGIPSMLEAHTSMRLTLCFCSTTATQPSPTAKGGRGSKLAPQCTLRDRSSTIIFLRTLKLRQVKQHRHTRIEEEIGIAPRLCHMLGESNSKCTQMRAGNLSLPCTHEDRARRQWQQKMIFSTV